MICSPYTFSFVLVGFSSHYFCRLYMNTPIKLVYSFVIQSHIDHSRVQQLNVKNIRRTLLVTSVPV